MLNTQKLLYILPDVAYLTELLPGKKPSTFTISSFRQINGEYMNDNEFIAENILKLFEKIDPEEYQLILPDFLFTNTIVSVKEKSDSKIKEYLSEKLLPELGLNTDTHQTDTTVLNEHGNSTKIQLSALEKTLIEPLQVSAEQTKIKIKTISPLSWSIKSLVSLEPSISVAQIGSMLYVALHYIGVDQASQASIDEVENIFETIKTLKGAEPSIQTIYLLSNELVEEKLKEHLSDTLPVQQLADKQDADSKMPSYVKRIVEAGMRTLSIDDYPVPKFEIGKAPAGAKIEAPLKDKDEAKEDEESSETDLPKPQKAPAIIEKEEKPVEDEIKEKVEEKTEKKEVTTEKTEEIKKESIEDKGEEVTKTETTPLDKTEDDEIEALLESLKAPEKESDDNEKAVIEDEKPKEKEKPQAENSSKPDQPIIKPKQVIKNKNQTKTMLKMVFVTLAVFFATIGIGIGIGLGVLRITKSPTSKEPISPVAEVAPTPSPSPSPSPSPEPEVDNSEISILIVNATTKAGYAGEIADKLTDSDFKTVKAGNAKGEYDEGVFVQMAEENQTLISNLATSTELELTYQLKTDVEDSKDTYDAVIILAQ
jgi:hypothetical protein